MLTPEIRKLLGGMQEKSGIMSSSLPCKMCNSPTQIFGVTDFSTNCGRLPLNFTGVAVHYFTCNNCNFIFTDFCDDWSAQDFVEFIYNDGYLQVDPEYIGIRGARTAQFILPALQKAGLDCSLLDFGSGLGTLAAALREAGFLRVANYDPYAGGEKPEQQFDIVTAFEVIEHSATPVETLSALRSHMKPDGCIVIGQTMIPQNIENLGMSWWYIAPRNGHISFYGHQTIARFATTNGLTYQSSGGTFVLHGPHMSKPVHDFVDHFPKSDILIFDKLDIDDGAAGWHAPEYNGETHFRWTARSHVSLGPIRFSGRLAYVSLPMLMAITEDFAHKCFLQIGNMNVPLFKVGRYLCAEFVPGTPGIEYVSLITPEPVRPCDINHSEDGRHLGLAFEVNLNNIVESSRSNNERFDSMS